jgi:hypothetical protein
MQKGKHRLHVISVPAHIATLISVRNGPPNFHVFLNLIGSVQLHIFLTEDVHQLERQYTTVNYGMASHVDQGMITARRIEEGKHVSKWASCHFSAST